MLDCVLRDVSACLFQEVLMGGTKIILRAHIDLRWGS